MNGERLGQEIGDFYRETDVTPPDSKQSAREVAARLPHVEQVKPRGWLPTRLTRATDRPGPIPATNSHTTTVIGRTQSMLSPVKAITAGALILAIGGVMLIIQPFDREDTTAPAAIGGLAGLVTEEIEPGVERIISDGAGHDLDETHPTYRYDMDSIFVLPDGTVWLSTTYSREDNGENPESGALTWALGQPDTFQHSPESLSCGTEGEGVTCFDPVAITEQTFLAGTPIIQVAVAPDGTVWAVGGYEGDNGGLYRITPD